jgi:hypothetical protein
MWLTLRQRTVIGLAIGLVSGTAPGRLPAALSAEAGAAAEPGHAAVRPEILPAVDLLALRGFDAVSYFPRAEARWPCLRALTDSTPPD